MFKIKVGGIYFEEDVIVCILNDNTCFCIFAESIENIISNTNINHYITTSNNLDPIMSKIKILETQHFKNYAYVGQLNHDNLKHLKKLCNVN